MKPLSIAYYLNDIGRAATEEARPRRESSSFRPRSLPSVHNSEPGPRPAFNALANPGAADIQGKSGSRRTPWERKPTPPAAPAGSASAGSEAFKPEDIAGRLAEAYARGREEGLVGAGGRLRPACRGARRDTARGGDRPAGTPAQRMR
jgi:hypothetical protein